MEIDNQTALIIEKTTANLMTRASIEILRDTIEEIASLAGVKEIRGIPVPTYIAARQQMREDELCADLADTNPTLASYVRQLVLSLRS